MGMNVGNDGKSVQSEINITPFIDVVLVLLIVFMAAMPVMMVKTPLSIPRKLDSTTEVVPTDTKQFVLTIKGDTSIVLNDGEKDTPIAMVDVARTLKPLLDAVLTEKVVFVDFEDDVAWSDALAVLDSIRSLASDNGVDEQKNEIKVALKVPDTDSDTTAPPP